VHRPDLRPGQGRPVAREPPAGGQRRRGVPAQLPGQPAAAARPDPAVHEARAAVQRPAAPGHLPRPRPRHPPGRRRAAGAGGELKNARQNILFALNDLPGGQSSPEALQAAALLAIDDGEKARDKSAEYLGLAEAHLEKAFAIDPKNTPVALLLAGVKRDLTKM